MSIDVMKQALEVLSLELPLGSHRELKNALRAAIEEEQETVTYDTGGFELEARFYCAAELREMLKALDEMNASVRRMTGEI